MKCDRCKAVLAIPADVCTIVCADDVRQELHSYVLCTSCYERFVTWVEEPS